MVGYNTPEDTLQSMLWAIQHHDLTNLLRAYTPAEAEHLLAEIDHAHNGRVEDYFSALSLGAFPGIGIVGRAYDPSNEYVAMQVVMAPGLPGGQITLQQISGGIVTGLGADRDALVVFGDCARLIF